MKRWLCCLLPVFLLCGCGAEETLEMVADEWMVPAMAQPREISLRLPENLVMPVLEQEGRKLYLGEDYEIAVETLMSGDLNATVQTLSGYEKDQLTVLETQQGDADRYDFVWTAAGEQGERLGRGTILDDGDYHYCLSVLRDADEKIVVWQDVFASFSLV
jgi:hypothetical protein